MSDIEPKQREPFHEQHILWPLTTGYTVLYLGLMVADFAMREKFTMPAGLMVIYLALLAAYAGDKEVSRWMGRDLPSRWGSIFIYAWFIFFGAAYLVKTFFPSFELPADLSKVCLQVLAIFFGSKVSGRIYSMRAGKQEGNALEFAGSEDKVMAIFDQTDKVHNSDVCRLLKVSSSTARRVLQGMETKGKITQLGTSGRGTCYVLAKQ